MTLRHKITEDRLKEQLQRTVAEVYGLNCKTAQLKAQNLKQKEEIRALKGELAIKR